MGKKQQDTVTWYTFQLTPMLLDQTPPGAQNLHSAFEYHLVFFKNLLKHTLFDLQKRKLGYTRQTLFISFYI